MKTDPIISFKSVYYRKGTEQWALNGIDFLVYPGEWITIVGANGSGKSTVAQLLNGLLVPTKGEVHVFGKDTRQEENRWEIHRDVGIVLQNPDIQVVAMTVKDDIAFGLENLAMPEKEIEERVQSAMSVLGLVPIKEREPHMLSPGEKQKLALAGILVMEPRVLVFDEPCSMLDAQSAKEIYQIMSALHSQGKTIIHITHDIEEMNHSGRILVMHGGNVLLETNPREIWYYSQVIETAGLPLPFALRLRNALIDKGIEITNDVTTMDDMVEYLWRSDLIK